MADGRKTDRLEPLVSRPMADRRKANAEMLVWGRRNTEVVPSTYSERHSTIDNRKSRIQMTCHACQTPWPNSAYARLNFGARSFRCPGCGRICRLNPWVSLRWTLIPWALTVISLLALLLQNGLFIFVGLFLLIRICWVFIAPRVVPMQCFRPGDN